MLTHDDIWRAVDRLAAEQGFSASGLAKRAGLDATTFNKSKRYTPQGKQRWPSTESIAKILAATGVDMDHFVGLIGEERPREVVPPRRIPVIGYAQAGDQGYFDDAGYPAGTGWDEIHAPEVSDPHAYALEVSGDSMQPAYRAGDLLILSPEAGIRRGDRVVVRTRDGEVMAKELLRRTANRIELKSLNPDFPDRTLTPDEVHWMARILWASQ